MEAMKNTLSGEAKNVGFYFIVFRLSRLCGLFPYSGFSISRIWRYYSFFIIFNLLVLSWNIKLWYLQDLPPLPRILLFGARLITDYLGIIYHTLAIIFKGNSLQAILSILNEKNSAFKLSCKRSRNYFLIFIILTIMSCSFFYYYLSHSEYVYVVIITAEIPIFLVQLIALQFFILLDCVRENLKNSKDKLRPNVSLLLHEVDFHDDMLEFSATVNEFYSWQTDHLQNPWSNSGTHYAICNL